MARAKNVGSDPEQAVLGALEDIKRLLILQLMVSGIQSQHIAVALGTSNSSITRLVPARLVKNNNR